MTRQENLLRAIARREPLWIPYRYDGSLTLLRPPVRVRPEAGGADDWGVNWVGTGTVEGSYPDGKPALSIDSVETLRAPETDFGWVTAELRREVDALSDRDTLVVGYNELTLYERAELLLGTTEFLTATELCPEAVERLLETVTDYQLRLTQAIVSSGVAGVRFTDDWGTQVSLFLAPRQWRRLIKPRLKRLYQAVRSAGAFVFQHSCGHIEEIVPDLIEIGVDVLDPCQPQANDIFRWKAEYGKDLSFMGGLDTQGYLSFGQPAEVRRRVREVAMLMGRGGGFIAAPSHSITIPEDNRRAMLETLEEVNRGLGS